MPSLLIDHTELLLRHHGVCGDEGFGIWAGTLAASSRVTVITKAAGVVRICVQRLWNPPQPLALSRPAMLLKPRSLLIRDSAALPNPSKALCHRDSRELKLREPAHSTSSGREAVP